MCFYLLIIFFNTGSNFLLHACLPHSYEAAVGWASTSWDTRLGCYERMDRPLKELAQELMHFNRLPVKSWIMFAEAEEVYSDRIAVFINQDDLSTHQICSQHIWLSFVFCLMHVHLQLFELSNVPGTTAFNINNKHPK